MSHSLRYQCPTCFGQIMDGMPLRYRKLSFACKCDDENEEGDKK